MKRSNFIAVLCWLCSMFQQLVPVVGWPDGAGGCGPAPSIGYPHKTTTNQDNTTRPVSIYPFNTGDRTVNIIVGSTVVQPNTRVTIKTKNVYPIILSGYTFKGFLVRLAVPNTTTNNLTGTIVPTDTVLSQVAPVCTGTQFLTGLTHTSNVNKNIIAGSLYFAKAIDFVNLDITAVFQNNNSGSEYSSAQFNITVVPCTVKKSCGSGLSGLRKYLTGKCKEYCD